MSAFEVGMRLHPVHDNGPVRIKRGLVTVHGHPVIEGGDAHNFHRGKYGHPHRLLGDPESRQHRPLAVRIRPAVAFHRGNDEGLRSP